MLLGHASGELEKAAEQDLRVARGDVHVEMYLIGHHDATNTCDLAALALRLIRLDVMVQLPDANPRQTVLGAKQTVLARAGDGEAGKTLLKGASVTHRGMALVGHFHVVGRHLDKVVDATPKQQT